MDRSAAEGDAVGLQTLDVAALRDVRLTRQGRFRSSGDAFDYEARLLGRTDISSLVELHEDIMASLPDPPMLYRRDDSFFLECITEGCVAGAFYGPKLVAYAALYVPGLENTNYGRDIGLAGPELEAVGHLAGSAVAPAFRGNRIQQDLVALRNSFARRSGTYHMCGEVVPGNVISIANHLAKGFYLTGHRIDDFGDRCYVLHADLRRQPLRVAGDVAVEAPVLDMENFVELVDGGRWGFEVRKQEDDFLLRFGRFS